MTRGGFGRSSPGQGRGPGRPNARDRRFERGQQQLKSMLPDQSHSEYLAGTFDAIATGISKGAVEAGKEFLGWPAPPDAKLLGVAVVVKAVREQTGHQQVVTLDVYFDPAGEKAPEYILSDPTSPNPSLKQKPDLSITIRGRGSRFRTQFQIPGQNGLEELQGANPAGNCYVPTSPPYTPPPIAAPTLPTKDRRSESAAESGDKVSLEGGKIVDDPGMPSKEIDKFTGTSNETFYA